MSKTALKHLRVVGFLGVAALALSLGGRAWAQEGQAVSPAATTSELPKKIKKKKAVSQAPNFALAESAASDEPKGNRVGSSQDVRSGETLIFKTDNTEPSSSGGELREPLKFTVEPKGGVKAVSPTETRDFDDAGFKAYVGYPKHKVGANLVPQTLSAKWNYQDQDYNFSSSSLGFGVWYELQVTPLIHLLADWSRYTSGVDSGPIAGGTYQVLGSDQTYDVFSVSGRYCFVSSAMFFHRYCPGIKIQMDAYPILEFVSSTNLEMSKVTDITVGITFDYDYPMSESRRLKARAGYNHGTGLGNSGELTSKINSAIQLQLGVAWFVSDKHELSVTADYVMRSAELSGKVGAVSDKWKTSSGNISGLIGYSYAF